MKAGDVVRYRGSRWKVLNLSHQFKTAVLVGFDGAREEVPDDLDIVPPADASLKLEVLYNPALQWPFVAAPLHARSGPLKMVSRGNLGLTPLVDWVPSDFLRPGGSIFFSPELRLRQGEVLVGTHQDGYKSRIAISKSFGTLHRRKHLAQNPRKVKGPPSVLDRLLGHSLIDEDED